MVSTIVLDSYIHCFKNIDPLGLWLPCLIRVLLEKACRSDLGPLLRSSKQRLGPCRCVESFFEGVEEDKVLFSRAQHD